MTLTIRSLTPDLWPALEDLFGRSGASNGCWCMYWLAFEGEKAVGWCQLTPRADLPWLDRWRAFARVDEMPVWSISCFYVRRNYRQKGVTAALIAGALKAAKRAGAPSVEVYPWDAAKEKPAYAFTGFASTFARAGFKEVARQRAGRPIMRHDLNVIAR